MDTPEGMVGKVNVIGLNAIYLYERTMEGIFRDLSMQRGA